MPKSDHPFISIHENKTVLAKSSERNKAAIYKSFQISPDKAQLRESHIMDFCSKLEGANAESSRNYTNNSM